MIIGVYMQKRAPDGILYRATEANRRWKCGCCKRGNVQAKVGWMCKVCLAKVKQLVTEFDLKRFHFFCCCASSPAASGA